MRNIYVYRLRVKTPGGGQCSDMGYTFRHRTDAEKARDELTLIVNRAGRPNTYGRKKVIIARVLPDSDWDVLERW
jgi:hypothetical protein